MSSIRVRGHARRYESLDSTGGTARVQRGGTVSCACGWAKSARSREDGANLHDAHKSDVTLGVYAQQIQTETDRRVAMYRDILASPARMRAMTVTAEQVQGWLDDLLSGKTVVSI